MIALKIEDIRQFTSSLFMGETFDKFLLKEAVIVTFNTFTIDGRIRQEFYTQEELEEKRVGEYSAWKTVKPFCFSMIKGKKLPGSFHIILQLPPGGTEHFVTSRQIPMEPSAVNGLYVNIRYDEGKLYCVTGTSVNYFTMDKTLDQEWDQALRQFLKKSQIEFEEE